MANSTIKELVTKFADKTTDDERIEGYQVLLDKQKHEIGPSDELVSGDIARLLKLSYSDALSKNLELASRALKCLGYFIHHPVYVQSISDEEAATILLILVKAVTMANDKVHCNLSIWCISVQQFKASVVDLHIESLVEAIVHAIDNPMGSLAVTFEAMQALATIRKITPTKTREHSHVWAPPIYRRLVSNEKRERDVVDSALREMLSAIKPPTPALSQVTAIDIKKSLLIKMKTMVATSGQAVVAINAWRWFVILLGDQLGGSASMVNEMLKIPEATFISNDAQARIASQVSWESLIDALVPVFAEGPAQVRPKRLKLLLMPILNAIKFEQDTAAKNQYWRTWMHLLRRLDRRIHEPHVFDNAVIPGLEVAFLSGPLKDPWIWKNCMALVESYVSSRTSIPSDFGKLASLGLDNHDQSLPSLQQVANTIKWEPWEFTELESLLTVVRTLWDCGMKDFQENRHSTSGKSSMYAAVKIWYIIVKAVETDQRNIVTPSSKQVGAVHSLLKFVSKISTPETPRGMECVTWTWRFINILVDELGPIILASTLYRMASPWEDSGQFSAEDLSSQNTNSVSPVIYLIAVWLKLVSVEPLDQSEEADILQRTETLIRASKAGDNMGNLQGIMTSLDWLSRWNRDTLLEKKGIWVFLLKVWRVVTEKLKTDIEGINDIPSGDTGYRAVFTVLLFPVKFYLQGEVQGNITDISVAELKSVRICWIQLHDTLCRISSLRNSYSNSYSAGFFQRVLKVIDGQLSRDSGQRLANFSEFVELVGTGVISALNQVEVSSVAVLALNRKRRRFSCTIFGGSGIDGANNVKDLLSVAARLLTMAATKIGASSAEVTRRMMEALSSYAKRIYSQHDTLLLLHVLAKPLACWLKLGLHKDLSMALVEKLHKLWDGLLYCLKECHPALLFDSNLLAVQASSLAYALQYPYHPISNITLSFWEATYGSKASSLKFPPALVPVLGKLKRKVAITLPGFDAAAIAVHGEKRTKQIRSLEADDHMEERHPTKLADQEMTTESPDAGLTGTKSAMVLGVDNENTSEPSLNSASKDISCEEWRSTPEALTAADPRKKVRVSDVNTLSCQELPSSTNRQTINDYVVVASSQLKKSRPLTDHQKEVRKLQRREGPGVRTYTCADFSQGDLPGDSEDPEADLEDFCHNKLDTLPAALASTSAEAEKNLKIASASRQTSGIARDSGLVNEALAYAADFTAPDSMQLIMDGDPNGHSDAENLGQRFSGSEQEAGMNDNVEAPRKLKRRQTQPTYPMRNSSSTAEMNTSPSCEQKDVAEQGMSKLIGLKTTMGMLSTLATWSRWDELDAQELMQAKMLLERIQEKVGT